MIVTIAKNHKIKPSELSHLIELSGAKQKTKVPSVPRRMADGGPSVFVLCDTKRQARVYKDIPCVACVSSDWLLDSISNYSIMPPQDYAVKHN